MKKLLMSCWLVLMLPLIAFSQSVDWKWIKQAAGPAGEIIPSTSKADFDAVGNAYQAGNFDGTKIFDTNVSLTGGGLFVLKRDINGTLQWIKQVSGTGGIICNAIHVDNANGITITGWYGGTQTFAPGISITTTISNGIEAFIAKYDSNGNFSWVKKISGGGPMGYGLASDNVGNIYTVGQFVGQVTFVPGKGGVHLTSTSNEWETYIAKYDSNGNFSWAKIISGSAAYSFDLDVDNSQNVYVAGSFTNTIGFGSGISLTSGGAFYAKYDNLGNALWAKKFDGTQQQVYGIELDNTNNIFLAGNFTSSTLTIGNTTLSNNGLTDGFLAKFDNQGNPVWAKSIGGTKHETVNPLKTDVYGNVYIGGTLESTINIGSTTLIVNGSGDGFFAKYDNNGNVQFAKQIGLNNNLLDFVNTLAVDNSGNILVGGIFSGTSYFNPTTTLTATDGDSDIFMAKYWQAPEINVKQGTTNIASNGNYNFGSISVGNNNITTAFTIENTGDMPLKIFSILPSSADFIVNSNIDVIQPHSSATFTITFNPTSFGNKNGHVTINNNDSDENPYIINLQGVGLSPEINIKQGGTSIPNNGIFNTSGRVRQRHYIEFSIENLGNDPLTGISMSVTGLDANDFYVYSIPNSVGANTSTIFRLEFSPSKRGDHIAQLNIRSNDADESLYVINLVAIGLCPKFNLRLGTVNIPYDGIIGIPGAPAGQISEPAVFTIENLGNEEMILYPNNQNGTYIYNYNNNPEFLASSPTTITIPIGGQATFEMRYAPAANTSGSKFAYFTISNSDVLTGSCLFRVGANVLEPEINVKEGNTHIYSNTTLDLGVISAGSGITTLQKTLVIENIGQAPLDLSNVNIIAGAFTTTQPESPVLMPGTSTTIVITFTPPNTFTSTYSAILSINNNDRNENPYTINITARTIEPEINITLDGNNVLNNSNVYFGVIQNGQSVSKTFTIQNLGQGELRLNSTPNFVVSSKPENFIVNESLLTNIIPSGASKTFTVTFTANEPSTTTLSGKITISNTDFDETNYEINLSGIVSVPTIVRSVSVFPNPSPDGIFNVDFTSSLAETFSVEILNNQMQVVQTNTFTKPIGTYSFTMNITNQPSGLYTMRIISTQGILTELISRL